MARRRFHPKYVTAFSDRHGKERLRFRRKGYKDHYFKSQFGTQDFGVEYRACLDGKIDAIEAAIERTVPGSIAEAVTRYLSVPERLGPTPTTQGKIRSILMKFRDRYGVGPNGPCMLVDCDFEVIEAIVADKRKRVKVDGRWEGGIEAARKLRKELLRFFTWCMKARMIDHNPVELSDRVKVPPAERSSGFHTWTEPEIAKYRDTHPRGTKARLAMELILWTDQRSVDAIHLGPQHIEAGRFGLSQSKTGRGLRIKVASQLLLAINAMGEGQIGEMCFLINEWGRPFTRKGFGNKFRDW